MFGWSGNVSMRNKARRWLYSKFAFDGKNEMVSHEANTVPSIESMATIGTTIPQSALLHDIAKLSRS